MDINNLKVGDLIPIGGSGNVKANEVLEGKTFSSDDGTDLVGTMKNNESLIIHTSVEDKDYGQGYFTNVKSAGLLSENDDYIKRIIKDTMVKKEKSFNDAIIREVIFEGNTNIEENKLKYIKYSCEAKNLNSRAQINLIIDFEPKYIIIKSFDESKNPIANIRIEQLHWDKNELQSGNLVDPSYIHIYQNEDKHTYITYINKPEYELNKKIIQWQIPSHSTELYSFPKFEIVLFEKLPFDI